MRPVFFFYLRLMAFLLLCLPANLKGDSDCNPKVFVGVIIRNYDKLIPFFLRSIENLDYNKKQMHLQIDVCNSSEEVAKILSEWIAAHRSKYGLIGITFREDEIENMEITERNRVFAAIKDGYLAKAVEANQDYCFILSSEVFLLPRTLKYLVEQKKSIISPLLRPLPEPYIPFRNFFADVSENGYYKHHEDYDLIANRKKLGTFKVPCINTVYLIDTRFCDKLNFSRHFYDWDLISFSKNARENGIDQYICNEREFGFLLYFTKEMTLAEQREFTLIGTEFEMTPAVLDALLSKYYPNDPDLREYASRFNCSDYAIFRVKNQDLFYVDEVNDYIKNYIIKQGWNWEENIHEQFKKYAKPGTIALDIGGHIGTHALNLSRIVGEKGKVYVFEPQAKMFCELAINMYLNRCGNVELFHNALGAEEKKVEIFIPDEEWKKNFGNDLVNEGHGTVKESIENAAADCAKMFCLDKLNLNNVSMIKMDVEGYEMEVIKGGIETIKRNKPVMIIEIFQNEETSRKIKEIEELGYTCANLAGADFIFIPLELSTNNMKN